MSNLEVRETMYRPVEVNRSTELDYLDGKFKDMSLDAITRYRITAATAYRGDLISYLFYRNYNYGWLICQHNQILDPFNDLGVGVVVEIPSLDDYYRYASRESFE